MQNELNRRRCSACPFQLRIALLSRGLAVIVMIAFAAANGKAKGPPSLPLRSQCRGQYQIDGQDNVTNVLCGNLALERGDYKNGMQRFLQVLKSDPRNFQAQLGKGWAEFQLGQTEEGMADLRRAYALDPKSFDANLAMATAYANTGHYDIALKFYTRAVKADPNNPDGFRGLGVSYAYLGDHARSAKAYGRAMQLLPASKRAGVARLFESQSLAAQPLRVSGEEFSAPYGFTRAAERIIEKSRQNAHLRGHGQVESIDIARELALDQADGDIRFVFSKLAINPARFLAGLDRLAPDPKTTPAPENIPFSPESMRAMLLAQAYAREYPSSFAEDPQASSLHLLLGIVKTADAPFKRFLDGQGINETSLFGLVVDHYGVYASDRRQAKGKT